MVEQYVNESDDDLTIDAQELKKKLKLYLKE